MQDSHLSCFLFFFGVSVCVCVCVFLFPGLLQLHSLVIAVPFSSPSPPPPPPSLSPSVHVPARQRAAFTSAPFETFLEEFRIRQRCFHSTVIITIMIMTGLGWLLITRHTLIDNTRWFCASSPLFSDCHSSY